METIKKYTRNRKLYSSTKKGYVTLNYINDIIREGKSVEVISYPEGKDVTAETLTEALKHVNVPVETLAGLIAGYGQ